MTEAGRQTSASNKELLQLDAQSSLPIWLQLKRRFICLIESGHYLPNDQLPTVRGLAAEIEINYNTVSKVYRSLEEDGYIVSKPRQGAYVLDVSGRDGVKGSVAAEIVTTEYINRCLSLGLSVEDVEKRFREALDRERAKLAPVRAEADGASSIIDFSG